MNILTIQLGHNASALLAGEENGRMRVWGGVSQERFDNVKNSAAFPEDAIKWLLLNNHLEPGEITNIGICGLHVYSAQIGEFANGNSRKSNRLRQIWKTMNYKHGSTAWMKAVTALKNGLSKSDRSADSNELESKLRKLGFANARIEHIEHHVCHANTPLLFFGEPVEPYLILTLDGSGDKYCASVNKYEDGQLSRLSSTDYSHSLGYVYSKTTEYLGMKALEHEYKVMGLAAYSKPEYYESMYEEVFGNVCWVKNDGSMEFDSKFPLNYFDCYLSEKIGNGGYRFDNIAGALQHLDEKLVAEWVRNCIDVTGIHNIMTCGGVFMNVKANMKIQNMSEVNNVKFMPTCGDETNPFGAAYYIAKNNGKDFIPVNTLYLGHEYTNAEVLRYLENNRLYEKYSIHFINDIETEIANLLADFKVVARIAGRAEFGARSLGNRAILANPSDLRSFYMVNDQIKVRDFWMPFAPTIMDVDADRYLHNEKNIEAPYMITGFDTTEIAQNHLRAAMHQKDKSVRPQILKEQANPRYYRVLSKFRELTGIGGVMNTSFNLHGYPLAEQLPAVFFTFANSDLQYMAVENYLICKKGTNVDDKEFFA